MADVYMEELFNNQTKEVISTLLLADNRSYNDALKLWQESMTRKLIQDFYKMYWVSGTRCYYELMYEIRRDSLWFRMEFSVLQ